jgi:hypothetical protein
MNAPMPDMTPVCDILAMAFDDRGRRAVAHSRERPQNRSLYAR